MGSRWSFFRRRLTPHLQTHRQTDRRTRSTASVLFPSATTSASIRKHSLAIGAALKLRLCLLIWRLDEMQMKRDPINGLLICLVRLYGEVSPAPFWMEPCLFWTHITHVTASLQRDPPHTHTHEHTHTPPPSSTNTQPSSLSFTPISSFACAHNLRHSAWDKKKNHMQGSQ